MLARNARPIAFGRTTQPCKADTQTLQFSRRWFVVRFVLQGSVQQQTYSKMLGMLAPFAAQ
jgi:hypothetical protein